MQNGVFYGIRNSVNEWSSEWTKFCLTLEDAKRELLSCNDWYCRNGTGKIFEIQFSISKEGVISFIKNEIIDQ